MSTDTLIRDSIVVFAMVVISAYVAAVVFGLTTGQVEASQAPGSIVLAVGLVLVVVGLGFLLWRSARYEENPDLR